MAQLKGGSKVSGDVTVSGTVRAGSTYTTDISTKIQNNYNKIINMLGTSHSLPTTLTLENSCTNGETTTAYLIGNSLRVHFKLTLPSAKVGDITNFKMGYLTITHNGKIKSGYAVGFNDYGYGGQMAMYTGTVSRTATTLTVNLNISAIGNSTTTVNSYFVVPVVLDAAYF